MAESQSSPGNPGTRSPPSCSSPRAEEGVAEAGSTDIITVPADAPAREDKGLLSPGAGDAN